MFYPLMIQMRGRRVVIAGGGSVALRKYRELSEAGAAIIVVSPELNEGFRDYRGSFTYFPGLFRPEILEGVDFAVACTDSREVNSTVRQECAARGIPVCVCDDAAASDFIFPATVTRGAITVAVSTGGSNPGLARRLKNDVASILPSAEACRIESVAASRQKKKSDN